MGNVVYTRDLRKTLAAYPFSSSQKDAAHSRWWFHCWIQDGDRWQ